MQATSCPRLFEGVLWVGAWLGPDSHCAGAWARARQGCLKETPRALGQTTSRPQNRRFGVLQTPFWCLALVPPSPS